MMMFSNDISFVIFSKDRPMQLDATLSSFYLHCDDYHRATIFVLFLSTSDKVRCQYASLAAQYPNVIFISENYFYDDLLNILFSFAYDPNSLKIKTTRILRKISHHLVKIKNLNKKLYQYIHKYIQYPFISKFTPIADTNKVVLFCVDDNIFTDNFCLSQIKDLLLAHSDAIGFSLRLGKNIQYCYMLDQVQPMPKFHSLSDKVSEFNWTDSQFDFNYPLEISSSMYRLNDILPLINAMNFHDPNSLESQMALKSKLYVKKYPILLSFNQSVAFCNPINIVQQTMPDNRQGEREYYSPEQLVDYFEDGLRIDVAAFSDVVTNSCHQEMQLKFFKKEKNSRYDNVHIAG